MTEMWEWKILLIDDDEDDYRLIDAMLGEFHGREVHLDWVATYQEGFQKSLYSGYDAILIDYDLGVNTGIELINELSSRLPATATILYTGRGSYAVDVEAMEAGATLYLTKSEATPLLLERSIRYAIERKQIEMELRRSNEQFSQVNRTLRAISNSNQALMRATDEPSILNEVCRIVVQDCGYSLVWVGFAEQTGAKAVRPVAHYGFDKGYIEDMQITWQDVPRGRGPTGTAIRTGQPTIVKDMRTDPSFSPWREAALSRGYASAIALPLIQDGPAFGVMTIYSTRPNSFPPEETALLTELSGDLAFGIHSIRIREANAAIQQSLRQSEEHFRLALKNMPIVVANLDLNLRYTWIYNPVEGFQAENVIGKVIAYSADAQTFKITHAHLNKLLETGEPDHWENTIQAPIGEITLKTHAEPLRDADGRITGVAIVSIDITEQKKAERQLKDQNERLQRYANELERHQLGSAEKF